MRHAPFRSLRRTRRPRHGVAVRADLVRLAGDEHRPEPPRHSVELMQRQRGRNGGEIVFTGASVAELEQNELVKNYYLGTTA